MSCESLSPIQKTPHNATAMSTPNIIFEGEKRSVRHHPGLNMLDRIDNVHAEAVIINQKFTWGAVHGQNITLHRTAARTIVNNRRFILQI